MPGYTNSTSTTVGVFTLTAIDNNGNITYTLKTPDGTGYIGSSIALTNKGPVAGSPDLVNVSVGNDQYIYLSPGEAASLAAALPQMKATVDSTLQKMNKTVYVEVPAVGSTTTNLNPTNLVPSRVTETSTSITTRTNGVDIVVDKAPVVTETDTQVITRTGGFDIVVDKPPATDDPAVPASIAALGDEPIAQPVVSQEELANLAGPLPEIDPVTGEATAPSAKPPATGLTGATLTAASAAVAQDQADFAAKADWRVRLSLTENANYLYKANPPGILQPLFDTDGVIFPYVPTITVNYAAQYEPTKLTHTNYTIHQYQNSSVDQVTITCEFTCQDVAEANYLLAVIHFFRSMTKMFYGQDSDPKNGTPPPLCYLYGMGGYQFDALPLAIAGFNYALPPDVDYIKTTGVSAAGTPQPTVKNTGTSSDRLGKNIQSGGKASGPNYTSTPTSAGETATWVPTKIQLSITCLPIMSRNQVSNNFSLKDYATGNLLQGTRRKGGGFW